MANIIGYVPGVINKVRNPSAENGVASYGFCGSTMTGGGAVPSVSWITAVTEKAWVGNYSTKLNIPAGAISAVSQSYTLCRAFSGAEFTGWEAGAEYAFGVRYLKNTAAIRIQIRIMWRTGTTTLKNTTYAALDDTLGTAGEWVNYYIEGDDMPVGADNVYFYLSVTSLAGSIGQNVQIWLDGAMIVKGPMTSYVDGNQGPDYYWTGTVNNSESGRNAKPIYGASGRGGQILLEPMLFKADKYNSIGEDISSSILSGMVEMRTDRELKMQFKGNLHGVNPVVAYTDYIAPFMRLTYPDGSEVFEQIGLYSIAPPGEDWNESYVMGSFQAYDLTWNLAEASFGVPFTVAAGTNIVQSMRDILNNQGFTRWNIPDSPLTFTTARTWETDASILRILNDHAEAIGYYSFHADRIGQWVSFPYNGDNREPAIKLFSGHGSQVIGTIRRERNPEGTINMVRVLKEGAADGSISYTQTNSNPLSPVSTVKLGRIKFREVKVKELASLAVAKDIARKYLRDAASVYTRYQIVTLPDPSRNVWETYDTEIYMSDGTPVITGTVLCSGWDIGFTPTSAAMTHYCNRYEPYE